MCLNMSKMLLEKKTCSHNDHHLFLTNFTVYHACSISVISFFFFFHFLFWTLCRPNVFFLFLAEPINKINKQAMIELDFKDFMMFKTKVGIHLIMWISSWASNCHPQTIRWSKNGWWRKLFILKRKRINLWGVRC